MEESVEDFWGRRGVLEEDPSIEIIFAHYKKVIANLIFPLGFGGI